MDFRPHLQVLEYQLQHQNNNCLYCASYCLEFNSMLQQNNRINWIISILPITVQTFKHSNIITTNNEPITCRRIKICFLASSYQKRFKKIYTWPKKFVVFINDVLVYYLKHSWTPALWLFVMFIQRIWQVLQFKKRRPCSNWNTSKFVKLLIHPPPPVLIFWNI